MNLMMMKMLFGGNKGNCGGDTGFMGKFGQMLMMQQFFGGNKDGDAFENMFDLHFDDEIISDDDEDDDKDDADTKKAGK